MDRNDVMAALYRAAIARADVGEAQRLEIAIESKPAPAPEPYHPRPYALWYAEHGFPVFPLSPGAKTPLSGSRGLLDATTDVENVAIDFEPTLTFNIGIATGHLYDVVDIDGHDGMSTIVDKLSENPSYLTVAIEAISMTPRGLHLWVTATGRGNSAAIINGIDYRGKGGYVVAPPSQLYAGTYQSFLSGDVARVYAHYRWLMPPKGDA